MSAGDASETPGLVASHASYALGAVKEAIGSLTSSSDLAASGTEEKDQAVSDMHTATTARHAEADAADEGVSSRQATESLKREGGLESAVGRLVGCEGLQEDGAEKEAHAQQ